MGIYLAGLHCKVDFRRRDDGGQCAELYPEKPIYDIPGMPEVLAGDLVKNLIQQAAPFKPEYCLGAPVMHMKKAEDVFTLTTSDVEVEAKVVIIAGGGGMFTPRKPALANLADFEEKSVFYAVKDKQQFTEKTIVIAGGGDSALDWAVELAEYATHIHLVHRRADYRAAEATVQQMKNLIKEGKITQHTGQLAELFGTDGQLEKLNIKDNDGALHDVQVDNLLCFFGLAPNAGPFADWNLKLDGKKIATEPVTQKTSIDGILAIGDMAQYEGKIGLILVGFAEAAQAAKTAQSILEPERRFKVVYSTSHKPGG